MFLKFTLNRKHDLEFCSSQKEKEELNKRYQKLDKYLKYSRNEYQKSWDEINNSFSSYIENTTGYKWQYKKYYCLVSPSHVGISNWGNSNKIIRGWKENPYSQRRITAHELIISHYFFIIRKHYGDSDLSDNQIWALAEIAAFALTSLTKKALEFWPWDKTGYYTNHNYPEIVKLQIYLKSRFLNRKNFDDYIVSGIKAVKKLLPDI